MKIRVVKIISLLLCLASPMVMAASDDFTTGTPAIESISALAFHPDGVLFVGDPIGGAIFAVDIGDNTKDTSQEAFAVRDIEEKIAAMLGSGPRDIRIVDMAVNPVSQNAYLAVLREGASHVLLKVTRSGEISDVPLKDVRFMRAPLPNPVSKDKKRRGRSLRGQAVTDLLFVDGELFIAGLSNEEFASTMSVLAYPFGAKSRTTSLEIYHAAHGKYETHAPIRTFLAYHLKNQPHLIASYTCTPLVTFPMHELKTGEHLKGMTIAELGSGNRPLDMVVYQKEGKEYVLIANSNRTLMKVDVEDIANANQPLTEPVRERNASAGVGYISVSQVGVQQLDNLNEKHVLVVKRQANGALDLTSIATRRL